MREEIKGLHCSKIPRISSIVTCFRLAELPIGGNAKDTWAGVLADSITGTIGAAFVVWPGVLILASALEVCTIWVTNWRFVSNIEKEKVLRAIKIRYKPYIRYQTFSTLALLSLICNLSVGLYSSLCWTWLFVNVEVLPGFWSFAASVALLIHCGCKPFSGCEFSHKS